MLKEKEKNVVNATVATCALNNPVEVVGVQSEVDYLALLSKMQLTSDLFFGVSMEDTKVCEEFFHIITEIKLEVLEVKNQYAILNLTSHSIVMDIYGRLINDKYINLEMHPQSGEDRIKRIRYNISSIDIDNLRKGENYRELSDVYTIYITTADFLGTKKVVNHIVRMVEDTDVTAANGVHEYYVSLSGQVGTKAQLALMQYIQNSDNVMESEYFPKLVQRVRFLKEKQGGQEIMCELFNEAVKPLLEKERIASEKRGEERGEGRGKECGILGAINLMRELEFVEENIENKLVEKFLLTPEKARKYMCM